MKNDGKGHPPLAGAKIASFFEAIFLMRKISIAVILLCDAKNCITEIFFFLAVDNMCSHLLFLQQKNRRKRVENHL